VFSTPSRYKRDPITEIIDLYIALEVVPEVSNFDAEVALKNLIDRYLETLETCISKLKKLEELKLESPLKWYTKDAEDGITKRQYDPGGCYKDKTLLGKLAKSE
ncbi:5227_t:CDS:2, partial [Racocetra persica]